jgi:PadR family transcriptional regulator
VARSGNDNANKELVGASTAVLILGVLRREGASYGYDIVRRVNERSAGAFTWQEGTIYPVLHKLERQGLIRGRWQQSTQGRRRKYYALTAAGRTALNTGTRQWQLFHSIILQLTGANHGC